LRLERRKEMAKKFEEWRIEAENIRFMPLKEKVKKSIGLIKKACDLKPKGTPLIINFSGGKDSTAMLTLARKVTDDIECVYVDGGIDLPDTVQYVKDRARKLNVKLNIVETKKVGAYHRTLGDLRTLEDYIRHYKYFPSAGSRWCSVWIKQRPMRKYWVERFGKGVQLFKLVGVRQFESPTRFWKYANPKHYQKYCAFESKFFRHDNEHHPAIIVYALLEWTKEDIIDFLKEEKVPLHSGYNTFGISGCKWCPVHKVETYEKVLKVYPDIYDDFIELEKVTQRPCVEGGKYWLRDIKKRVVG
jgi:phosphoadenosine phosphosulfate reductase